VELVEIDPFHAEPAQRPFDLAPNRLGAQDALRVRHPIPVVPHQPALREHKGPLASGKLPQQTADHFLGMAQPIHRGRIDPGDAAAQRVPHGGE
jgi:hypothetical protein